MRKMVTITLAFGLSLVLLSLGMPQLAGAEKPFCGDGKCSNNELPDGKNPCPDDCASGGEEDPTGGSDVCEGVYQHVDADITLADTLTLADNTILDTAIQGDDFGAYSQGNKLKITAFVGRDRFIFFRPDTTNHGSNGRTIDLILGEFINVGTPANCGSSVFVDEDGDGYCDPCADLITDFPGDVNVGRFLLSVADDLDDLALGEEHADNAGINFEVGDAFVFDPAAERFHLFWGSFTDGKARNRCPGSSPVVVERAGVDQWTVETTGNHLACLYSGENSIHTLSAYHGQVFAPFSATVAAQDPQVLPPDISPDVCKPPLPNTLPPFTCVHDRGVCGDGFCEPGEDAANCPVDCP